MFIAALFIIAKKWKQLKCPSTNEWINKLWYIHTMEYNSGMKMNEVLTHATTWMDFENIMNNLLLIPSGILIISDITVFISRS